MKRQELIAEIESILHTKKDGNDIPREYKDQVNILFSDSNVLNMCKQVCTPNFLSKLDYEQLKEIAETINIARDKLNKVIEEIDIYLFLKDGYRLDYEGLRKKFDEERLAKQYPNIDIKKLTELYAHPPRYIGTYYDPSLKIYLSPVVVRKFVIAILQMVFNEMDLLVAYTGSEGAGKSTLATQHLMLVHWILNISKIHNYNYDINKMMFNSLSSLRMAEDDHFSEKFRQFTLDEGNELHRQNWKEEEVQTFFQRLRRERYNQRIKSVCIPVLGELMTNIIMSRVNFIFEVSTTNVSNIGLLQKGDCNFYIIPRGNKIYSYKHKKELTRDYIKSTLYEVLKDKSYLKGLPKELIVNNFKFNGVNGFPKEQYIKQLKETNKSFSVREGMKLPSTTVYMLYKCNFKLKNQGIKSGDPRYATSSKFLQNLRNYFIDNPTAKKIEEEKFLQKYEEADFDIIEDDISFKKKSFEKTLKRIVGDINYIDVKEKDAEKLNAIAKEKERIFKKISKHFSLFEKDE